MCVLPSSSKKRKNGNFAVSEISTISLISRNISGYGGGRVPYVSQPVRIPLSRSIIHLSPDIQMQLSYRLPQHDAIMANPVVSSACSFSRFRIAWRVKRPFKPSVSDILSLWIIVWKKNEILIPRFVGVEISFHKSFHPLEGR